MKNTLGDEFYSLNGSTKNGCSNVPQSFLAERKRIDYVRAH